MLKCLRYQYRAFSRSIKYFDKDTRLMVYNSSIASRLNYADCVWNQCNIQEAKRLQSVQNMAIRRILNARPLDSAKPLIYSLGLLPLEEKRQLRSLVLFHKLVNGEGPKALVNKLNENFRNPSNNEIRTRNTGSGQYFIPRSQDTILTILRNPSLFKQSRSGTTYQKKLDYQKLHQFSKKDFTKRC